MDRYFSKIYRGFLVEQTDRGWVIPQLPSWSNGPVSQGPYSTYQIACHVLDRVLEEQDRGLQKSQQSDISREPIQSSFSGSSPSVYNSSWEALLFHILALVIFVSGGFGVITLIGKNPINSVIFFGIALITFLFAKKLEK